MPHHLPLRHATTVRHGRRHHRAEHMRASDAAPIPHPARPRGSGPCAEVELDPMAWHLVRASADNDVSVGLRWRTRGE
jgi:hypothetical protein